MSVPLDFRRHVHQALVCAAMLSLSGCGPSLGLATLSSLSGDASGIETSSTSATGSGEKLMELTKMAASGQKREALEALRKHAGEHPLDAAASYDYAKLALTLEDPALASDLLARAEKGENTDVRVLTAKGAALAEQGLYRESLAYFERAHRLTPQNPTVLSNYGMALVAAGDARKAEPYLRQAHRLRPSDEKIRQNLAIGLAVQGRDAEARALASDIFEAKSQAG
jgi:Flp pilus assembly protein TadD